MKTPKAKAILPPGWNPPPVTNLPPGFVNYMFFAFNVSNHQWIYSNDNATWYDERGNPVPAK